MKQRNQSIDAVKGVAIGLVMLGHVFVHNHMEDPYLYDLIKAVQMPLFMLVSGYLCGIGKKIKEFKAYGKVLGKRGVSYLVPFFAWLTVMHPTDLLGAYRTVFVQLDYGLWFLAVLFILTFMVSTAQLAAGRLWEKAPVFAEIVFWAVYGVLCLILVVQIIAGNSLLSPYLTIIYVPFYMTGYAVGAYGKKILCWGTKEAGKLDCRNNRLVQAAVMVMGLLFLAMVFVCNLNSMESKLDTIIQMAASFLGSIAIIYAVLYAKDGQVKKLFAGIGNYTLEIYVIHYHFANMLNFYDKQYYFYTLEGFVFVAASFAAMCAVTFVVIWILKKVKLLNFLLFGKYF